jgi:hypothetical protein
LLKTIEESESYLEMNLNGMSNNMSLLALKTLEIDRQLSQRIHDQQTKSKIIKTMDGHATYMV